MIRLGVNIDHVATVRNARGENYPNPYDAALQSMKAGADSITIHLREDRRHINDYDAKVKYPEAAVEAYFSILRLGKDNSKSFK